jgi:hypothetical protein
MHEAIHRVYTPYLRKLGFEINVAETEKRNVIMLHII